MSWGGWLNLPGGSTYPTLPYLPIVHLIIASFLFSFVFPVVILLQFVLVNCICWNFYNDNNEIKNCHHIVYKIKAN